MSEIVAHGVVNGITMGQPIGSPISCVAREQVRCPRCRGEDLSDAVACERCGVRSHVECSPCCSYNCGPLFTRDRTWVETDWETAPDSWRVTLTRSRSVYHPVHGPAHEYDHFPSHFGMRADGSWGVIVSDTPHRLRDELGNYRETIYTETVYHVGDYRTLEDGRIEVELSEDPEEGWDTYYLSTEERAESAYREQLSDADPDDYIDSTWLAEIAMDALRDGRTIDFAQLWRDEIDSMVENRDASELIESAYGECPDEVDLSDDMAQALGLASETVYMWEA